MNPYRLVVQLCSLGITVLLAGGALAQTAPTSDASSVQCANLESACRKACGSTDRACLAGCDALCTGGAVECAVSYDASHGACVVGTFVASSYASGTVVDTDYCGCYALCGQTPSPCTTGPAQGMDDFTTLSCEETIPFCYEGCTTRTCFEECDRRCDGNAADSTCSADYIGGSCWLTVCSDLTGDYDCETYEYAHPTGGVFDYCGCHGVCGSKPPPCN